MKELNVTDIVPRERHPLIFETFDGLNKGEYFVLINDHDPKPLYYQFLHERAGLFQWEYIEQGPDEWKVKISKNWNSYWACYWDVMPNLMGRLLKFLAERTYNIK